MLHDQPCLGILRSSLDAVPDYQLLYKSTKALVFFGTKGAVIHISSVVHWGTGKYQFLEKVIGETEICSCSKCPNSLSAYARTKVWVEGTQRLSVILLDQKITFCDYILGYFSQGILKKKVVDMDCVI